MHRRHPGKLKACLPLLFLSVVSLAGANESPDEVIAICRQAADVAARIACLEAALRGEAPPAEASGSDQPASAVISSKPAETANEDQPDIGRAQIEARTMTREQQLAALESARDLQVAAYSEVPYQRIVVHLENGQVWRQIAGDNQYFRVNLARNRTVDISESPLGGYQLRFNQMRRTIRVERVE